MKRSTTSTNTKQIPRREYLTFLKYTKTYKRTINKTVDYIYRRIQEIRIEMLGYSWGPSNELTGTNYEPDTEIIERYCDPEYDKDRIVVNYIRGGMLTFPATWLSDPNWENDLRKMYEEEKGKVVLDKLEKTY